MARQLKELKRRRAQLKAQLTRIETFFDQNRNVQVSEAQIRLKKLEECYKSFEENQTEIEALVLPPSLTGDEGEEGELNQDCEGERQLFEDRFYRVAAKAQGIINAANTVTNSNDNPPEQNNGAVVVRRRKAKVPDIKLAEFDGDFKQWMVFKNHFETTIHNDEELNGPEKHQYLIGVLHGKARAVIERFEISDNQNYENAWKLLKDTYDNETILIENHMDALLKIPSISKDDKAESMRKMVWHIQTHISSLKALKQPVEHWDMLIIHLAKKELDYTEQKDWQSLVKDSTPQNMPKLEQFIKFLTERSHTLRVLNQNKSKNPVTKTTQGKDKKSYNKKVTLVGATKSCKFCDGTHAFYKCETFMALSPEDRKKEVIKKKLCINCISLGHLARDCKSSSCKHCGDRHNTLLHQHNRQSLEETNNSSQMTNIVHHASSNNNSMSLYCVNKPQSKVILSTALVQIQSKEGQMVMGRALLDLGSQLNLITEELARKLKTSYIKENRPICGVNQSQTIAKKIIQIQVEAVNSNFVIEMECLVLPAITEQIPQTKIDLNRIIIPKNITLADPEFNQPGNIDLLIGAGSYWKIITGTPRNRINGQPALQNTRLGWIVGGEILETEANTSLACLAVTNEQLNKQLERFWIQESLPEFRHYTKVEKFCENYFKETTQRDQSGRLMVRLPIRPEVKLGNSKDKAQKRLEAIERKFIKNPQLKIAYSEFMEDYERKGHMSKVKNGNIFNGQNSYFIPHQAVIRPESVTTKVRVVFDASAKTTLGTSLNDKLLPGPNLQNDIFKITLKFRIHEYVITADVSQMFRQILVDPRDRSLQLILWRTNTDQGPQVYQLNMVTYGTACAPFHAMRCLRELALIYKEQYPAAAHAVENDFYMDDVLTGARTRQGAIELQRHLLELLKLGRFSLRKWRSNDTSIFTNIKATNQGDDLFTIDGDQSLKALGLLWNSRTDSLQYQMKSQEGSATTKREALSRISQVFDPLGLVAPVLINGKMFMQQLWTENMEWDQILTAEQCLIWNSYQSSLSCLNNIQIPRNTNPKNSQDKFNIFGFGDASEKAFGACLYAVSSNDQEVIQSHLLCAKAKVAPLKIISLPRLELEAALLLSQLYSTVKATCGERINTVSPWSDSTIVLGWIKTEPYKLKTFVANRIVKIQELTELIKWSHVPSEENPADLISRGVTAEILQDSKLWWHGPQWLQEENQHPTHSQEPETNLPELKNLAVVLAMTHTSTIIRKYSSFSKLCRIIAYCKRFRRACISQRQTGKLTLEEIEEAEIIIIRWVQQERFMPEILCLRGKRELPRKSPLASLTPFLDESGLIRVGGRLRHASISQFQKHQMVLPTNHHVTTNIIREEHERLQHCPPKQLLHAIRQRFWPISGRRETQKVAKRCIKCFKFKPTSPEVRMGDLPEERVKGFTRAFAAAGVDYAGPFAVKESRRRGRVPVTKGYIAVFTCFNTKAIHLEMVSELSSEAFLAALDRFTARRGLCQILHSDNGTNFTGADNQLKEIFEFLSKEEPELINEFQKRKINWRFIPPRSPHFGGLWEAAVKLVKRHLYTTMQGRLLVFEEYSTILANIKAVLNSRPLTPMSSDPNDLEVLTPAHFLVGDALVQPVKYNWCNTPENKLSRWQNLQKLQQTLWQRWQKEYLQELQKKGKWFTSEGKITLNTLVLLMEDNTPPLYWSLRRIVELHPGKDGEVRVVTVKTRTGLCKRAVRKVCPLPLSDQDDD